MVPLDKDSRTQRFMSGGRPRVRHRPDPQQVALWSAPVDRADALAGAARPQVVPSRGCPYREGVAHAEQAGAVVVVQTVEGGCGGIRREDQVVPGATGARTSMKGAGHRHGAGGAEEAPGRPTAPFGQANAASGIVDS